MSQMSYADRQLETALAAMFERKVTENRSTMRYWPAVSDRLGEQVSRRPWEYVMDALNRPRVPFNTRYIYAAASALVVVIVVLLLVLFLNTDDGTSGESVPAAPSEQIAPDGGDSAGGAPAPVPTPTVAAEPTATRVASTPTPTPVSANEPVTVFDPVAVADTVQFRFEGQWEAFRVRDWDAYRAFCLEFQRPASGDALLDIFYQTLLQGNDQTPGGFSMKFLEVTVLGPIDALVQYQPMEFSEAAAEPRAVPWTSAAGTWYSTGCSARS